MAADCMEWAGARTRGGYGVVRVGGKTKYVHRVTYEAAHDVTLTRYDCICHRCDNPACFNIDHLFLGTHAENMADMAAKGRQARGFRLPHTKLSDEQVDEIRRLKSEGMVQTAIAKQFGVSDMAVSNIVNNKRRTTRES